MNVTNLKPGLSTGNIGSVLQHFGLPDSTRYAVYFNDFTKGTDYTASDWVIDVIETGTGDASLVIQHENLGVLKLTNDNANDDSIAITSTKKLLLFMPGKEIFYKVRFKVNSAIETDWTLGFTRHNGAPPGTSDGVIFNSVDGNANIDFSIIKNSTATTASAISTLEDDTYLTLGFYFNGLNKIRYFKDDVSLGTSVITNLPDDEILSTTAYIKNGEAQGSSMSIDYIKLANER